MSRYTQSYFAYNLSWALASIRKTYGKRIVRGEMKRNDNCAIQTENVTVVVMKSKKKRSF